MEDVLVPLGLFGLAAFVSWVAMTQQTRRAGIRAEMQTKLLERFSSGPELAEFLETEAGKKFLEDPERRPHRPLRAAQSGSVITALGLGFLVAAFLVDELVIPGTILLALGIGLLAAAALAHGVQRRNEEDGNRAADAIPGGPVE